MSNSPSNPKRQLRGEAVRRRLIEAAENLLMEKGVSQITTQDVLNTAGVARNTLYKHFADVDALVEATLLKGFSEQVELDTQMILQIISGCESQDQFKDAMAKITRATNGADRKPRRQMRVLLISMARTRPALQAKLAALQSRMTLGLSEAFELAQEKGFIRETVSPRMGAIFIQSYTLGRILLDVEPCSEGDALDWMTLIDQVMTGVFTPSV
jgi:AcrR family transcriptional regulator